MTETCSVLREEVEEEDEEEEEEDEEEEEEEMRWNGIFTRWK